MDRERQYGIKNDIDCVIDTSKFPQCKERNGFQKASILPLSAVIICASE